LQAHRTAKDENWDAAAVMARSALQIALREHGAIGESLKQEIDDLASRGVLPLHMKEWAHELRELANESAHPRVAMLESSPDDVRDVVQFLDFLLQYLYNLPHEIAEYRTRRTDGLDRG
jgi:N-acyl-D-aspartate/D-glutamate deacylase